MERIKTFQEFYRFYLSEHRDKTCRRLHFVGTFLVFIMAFIAIISENAWLWLVVPLMGYGFAWVGHYFFEKNQPATFKYPLWSLISDFKMFFQLLFGRISFDANKDRSSS